MARFCAVDGWKQAEKINQQKALTTKAHRPKLSTVPWQVQRALFKFAD